MMDMGNKGASKFGNSFFDWSFGTRANTVKRMAEGEEISHDKLFLSFMSHNPAFISHGSKGLNGSIKGIGYAPKLEYIEKVLQKYIEHIKSYAEGDKTYSDRGLKVLVDCLYSDEAAKNIDFTCFYGVEMAFKHTYANYQENPEATMLFYQPPAISYELRGDIEIIGEAHSKDDPISPYDLPLLQQFVNAQHDVYHAPNIERWKTRPVYKFNIKEMWNKSVGPNGFGTKMDFKAK